MSETVSIKIRIDGKDGFKVEETAIFSTDAAENLAKCSNIDSVGEWNQRFFYRHFIH